MHLCIYLCIMYLCGWVPWPICGGQRTTYRTWFPLFTIWVLGIEFKLTDLMVSSTTEPLPRRFTLIKKLTGYLNHCSIALKRHHDQCIFSLRKESILIEGLFTLSEAESMIIIVGTTTAHMVLEQ